MKVWAVFYNPCTYESDAGLVSLHKTETGAKKALQEHKDAHPMPESWQVWSVEEVVVED